MSKNSSNNFKNKNLQENSILSSWKKVWMASPGPETFVEHFYLFLKGICMGTADIVPGVSGGTIAFISGIYESLLSAISSININFFIEAFKLNFKKALSELHLRFLSTLFIGISIAIVSTANLMHFLLQEYPVQIWSFFFGLITGSILVISRSIKNRYSSFPILVLGTIISYKITGLIPLNTPENSWFIFFCGMIAICAMILPGLSGAFILLILGKYEFITSALRNPFLKENIFIIIIFCSGSLIGIIIFSRLLHYGMMRWRDNTLAILTGIMIGSMQKVWPWKITLESQIIRGKEYLIREENILPIFNSEFIIAILISCFGFFLVLILEKISKYKTKYYTEPSK